MVLKSKKILCTSLLENLSLRKKKHINYKLIESDSESDGGEWTPDTDGDRLFSNKKEGQTEIALDSDIEEASAVTSAQYLMEWKVSPDRSTVCVEEDPKADRCVGPWALDPGI